MSEAANYRIVVAEPFDPAALERLKQVGSVSELKDSSPESLIAALPEADALLVRSRTHVTARVMEAAPKLRVIGRAGPSVDHIDLRVAQRRNIDVVYTPHVAVRSLTEFTLAMILATHRQLIAFDRRLREGGFESLRQPSGYELGRLTVGILGINPVSEGLGRILTTAFGCRIIYHDLLGTEPAEFTGEAVDLETLVSQCDILTLHLQLGRDTRNILDDKRLSLMKPTAKLVNTARGGLVDTSALAEMLKTQRLAGAAIDVFETEPLPANHPIRTAPNCIITPHIGSATLDVNEALFEVVDDVIRVLQGQKAHYPVPLIPEPPVSQGPTA